jgi:1,4-dihydroxy-2-naphthoate polyprenyltransferase
VTVAQGSARAWLLATRPKTLTAAAAPVLAGTAAAHAAGGVAPLPALAALLGAFLLQIGSNFANDVYDYEKGSDRADRLGPVRAVQAGLIRPAAMKRGMLVVFALALLVGVYLVGVAGWPIVVIGLASIASAVAYTGGPYPLGYNGLGDVFVFVFFGLVAVGGTAFVQVGSVPLPAWLGGVVLGLLAVNLLVVNNVRDADTDVLSGKRTLIVRFGRRFGYAQYATALVVAAVMPFVLLGLGFSAAVLAPIVAVLPGLRIYRGLVRADSGPAYNRLLGATAGVLFVYAVLWSLGVMVGAP